MYIKDQTSGPGWIALQRCDDAFKSSELAIVANKKGFGQAGHGNEEVHHAQDR